MSSLENVEEGQSLTHVAHIIALRLDEKSLFEVARRRVNRRLTEDERTAIHRVKAHPLFALRWKRCLEEFETSGTVTFDALDEERFLEQGLLDLQTATIAEDQVRQEFQRLYLELDSITHIGAS